MNAKEIPINLFLAAMHYLGLRKQDLPDLTKINWTVLQRTLSGEIPYRNGRELMLLRFFEKQGIEFTEQDGTYTMVLPKDIPSLKEMKPLTDADLPNLIDETSSNSGYFSLTEEAQSLIHKHLKEKQGYHLDLSPAQLDTIFDYPEAGLQEDVGPKKVRTLEILVRKRFLESVALPVNGKEQRHFLLASDGRALKAAMHAIASANATGKAPSKRGRKPKK